MKCNICHKEVVLVPSAAERAAKYGGKAADYAALFPAHAQCILDKRAAEVSALTRRRNQEYEARQVYVNR